MTGKLYLCATPIGNLKDITVRALETLAAADLIVAEDTRRTGRLLTHYEIKKPLVSFYEQNEEKVLPRLLGELRNGKTLVQVSDAGMPGISDPGHRLVEACVSAGIEVEVLPGPSAFLTALVLSSLPTHDFRFLGYLPRKSGRRKHLLEEVKEAPSTLVFYESPHRVTGALADLLEVLGDRRLFVARELTKMHEEQIRGRISEIGEELRRREAIKGEFVLVVEGRREPGSGDLCKAVEAVAGAVDAGATKSEAVKKAAARYGISKRLIYEAVHGGEGND